MHTRLGSWLPLAAIAAVSFASRDARAVVGNCETNGGATCLAQIQSNGGVIDDVFKDQNGKTGDQLPVFGKLYDAWPGCTIANAGNYLDEYQGTESQCPQVPPHNVGGYDFTAAASYVDALDWKYVQPVRLASGHGTSQAGACPSWDQSGTWVDENGATSHDGYVPREALVFDLGGPSNKVVVFAVNDHGPQPCESVEYTVWLTDNPMSDEVIDAPTTDGADPQKWNRAVLQKIYTHGWIDQRAPQSGSACGDTATYAVEADSFTLVYGLPCGITFRYAAVAAGNDGKDFDACSYDSFDAELDAVAGLTEEGTGVCPDADHDNYVDCNCPGAPSVCDCNDADPSVHPSAPEACDDPDENCDGNPGACSGGLVCYAHVCVPTCKIGEVTSCPPGSMCTQTDAGTLCAPTDCTAATCPPGSVCDAATKQCKPACDGVTCPSGQVCQDGQCKDPCAQIQCPNMQVCDRGECKPRCDCFSADVGCTNGEVCDRNGTNACVPPACANVSCGQGEHCNDQGACVGVCDGVACPQGQKCTDPDGCVPNCQGVSCPSGQQCDPNDGTCKDEPCNPGCLLPAVCQAGKCVNPEGGAGGSGGSQDGGPGDDASVGSGGHHDSGATSSDDGGCGCRVAGANAASSAGLLALVAGLSAIVVRRAKRRSRPSKSTPRGEP